MSTAIQNIIEHSLGDGARPSKFEVQVLLPTSDLYPDADAMSVLAKTSSFPGKAHETIVIKQKGRSIPMRGQIRYTQTWDVTFYLSEDHSLKIAMEQWMEAIDQKHNYDSPKTLGIQKLQNYFASSNTGYTMPIVITQLNFDMDKPRVVYTLQNCFPVNISPVEVGSENVGAISEFTVTFALSHYLINAVHYDQTNLEAWEENIRNIVSTAVNESTDYFAGVISGFTSPVTSAVNAVASEVTGTVSGVVDNLAQSFF